MVRITLRTGSQFDVHEALFWVADTMASMRGDASAKPPAAERAAQTLA